MVELPAGRRVHLGVMLIGQLEVEDEHDHEAVLVLHRHHVHEAVEARACFLQGTHTNAHLGLGQSIQISYLN